MKKKILSILLIGVMVIGLTGCNSKNSNSKATITDNNGDVVELSFEELENIFESNSVKFENNYSGATIKFKGIVKSISNRISCRIANTGCRRINFTNGWYVYLLDDTEDNTHLNSYDFTSFDVGDTLKITSKIAKDSSDIIIENIEQANRYSPTSTENTILEKVD